MVLKHFWDCNFEGHGHSTARAHAPSRACGNVCVCVIVWDTLEVPLLETKGGQKERAVI